MVQCIHRLVQTKANEMTKQLETNKSYYAVVQHGLTAVLLKANDTAAFNKHTVEQQLFFEQWIVENEATKVPYQALRREIDKRMYEKLVADNAAHEAKLMAQAIRETALNKAREVNDHLTFVSVLPKPERENFYTDGDAWSREFKQSEYDEAWNEYQRSIKAREADIAQFFDDVNDSDRFHVATALIWHYQFLHRGIFFSYSDKLDEYVLPLSWEYDDEAEGVYIDAIVIDANSWEIKGNVSLNPAEMLIAKVDIQPYRIKSINSYERREHDRVTIEIESKRFEHLSTTVYLDWNVDFETRIAKPTASISTGGTTRSTEATIAYIDTLNKAATIAKAWESQSN